MKCEEARLLFAATLEGSEDTPNAALKEHLSGCAECREQLDTLRTHWAALGLLADTDPSSNLRRNFYQALEAYQDGLQSAGGSIETTRGAAKSSWWRALFPQRPALQFAGALALLAAGVAIGYVSSSSGSRSTTESAGLRDEIASLRQLVTISMLQQQSAVDRLQGVTYSYGVEDSDTQVLAALLRTVNEDPSIDVRFAAVDALRPFSKHPIARRGLSQALARQTSPLMQIAIIDLLTELRERSAAPQMQHLLQDPDLDKTVRKRAQLAIQRLE